MADAIATVAKKSNRGSKPGERRGGRVKGVPNKATASIKEIAREYTDEAIKALVGVLRSESGPARVAAARELLDRAYGKPSQPVEGEIDVNAFIRTIERRVVKADN